MKLKSLLNWPEPLDDLLTIPDYAYKSLDSSLYDAEKGLLELYRNFVSEMLRMSLAGVAVIGFLSKFLKDGCLFTIGAKVFGILSMGSFAVSAVLALLFLYVSAEDYRYYIAGLRAKECDYSKVPPEDFLAKRDEFIKKCVWSKAGSAIFLAFGAISAFLAILFVL